MNIIVVDDDALNRETLAEVFRLKGHAADCAESAAEALALLSSCRYDAAVIDEYLVPGAPDGLWLVRTLRRHEAMKSVPVVMLTAAAADEFAQIAAEIMCPDLQPAAARRKPCDALEVLATLQRMRSSQ